MNRYEVASFYTDNEIKMRIQLFRMSQMREAHVEQA